MNPTPVDHWLRLQAIPAIHRDLLPAVNLADAPGAGAFETRKPDGKIPSRIYPDGKARGIADWPRYEATAGDVVSWTKPHYNPFIQTRLLRAIDIDVSDLALSDSIVSALNAITRGQCVTRHRYSQEGEVRPRAMTFIHLPQGEAYTSYRFPAGKVELLTCSGKGAAFGGIHVKSGDDYVFSTYDGLFPDLPAPISALEMDQLRRLLVSLGGELSQAPTGAYAGAQTAGDFDHPIWVWFSKSTWCEGYKGDAMMLGIPPVHLAKYSTPAAKGSMLLYPAGVDYKGVKHDRPHFHGLHESDRMGWDQFLDLYEVPHATRDAAAFVETHPIPTVYPPTSGPSTPAPPPPPAPPGPSSDPAPAPKQPTGLLRRASSYEMTDVEWLWPGYLARRKFCILAGRPGTGKTLLTLEMSAIVSRGAAFPDGHKSPAGDVVIWSSEDDASDTLIPRLAGAGADLSRVHIVERVPGPDGKERSFDPAKHMDQLIEACKQLPNLALIIIEPLVMIAKTDSHKNAETRRDMEPLLDLIRETGACLLAVNHRNKDTSGGDPVSGMSGSIAFGATARVVLMTARDKDSGEMTLVRAKANIWKERGGGYTYNIGSQYVTLPSGAKAERPKVVWGKAVTGEAQELINAAEGFEDVKGRSSPQRNVAVDFLRQELADGPVPAKELKRRSLDAGITEKSLRTAKEVLGVQTTRDGSQHGWNCSLPTHDFAPLTDEEGKS